MAWGANARNRSAEVRRVNYHEDGGSSGRGSNNRGSGGGGDMSPLGKIIIGGVCIYALGQVGLGWATDAIGNIKDALDFADDVKTSSSSSNKTSTSNNKTSKSGAKVKDKNVDIEVDISASDVADILEVVSENMGNLGINASKASMVVVDYSVFEDDAKYR